MRVRQLRVSNFRSFDQLNLTLGGVNVLVGPNASGKSNLLSALRFIRDIARHGLDDAISLQGGPNYLRNRLLPYTAPVLASVDFDGLYLAMDTEDVGGRLLTWEKAEYSVTIPAAVYPQSANVQEELLLTSGHSFLPPVPSDPVAIEPIHLSRKGQDVTLRRGDITTPVHFPPPGRGIPLPRFPTIESVPSLLNNPSAYFPYLSMPTGADWSSFTAFDFDPKLARQSSPLTGPRQLQEDGSNLAIALREVGRKPEFHAGLRALLPFVRNTWTPTSAGRVSIRTRERYKATSEPSTAFSPRAFTIPAELMSDGSLHLLALLMSVLFPPGDLVAIEEPERHLHPDAIKRFVALLRSTASSANRQFVLTTHSPVVLRYFESDEVLMVSRNDRGHTEIVRASDDQDVQRFINDGLGFDDLLSDGMLHPSGPSTPDVQ